MHLGLQFPQHEQRVRKAPKTVLRNANADNMFLIVGDGDEMSEREGTPVAIEGKKKRAGGGGDGATRKAPAPAAATKKNKSARRANEKEEEVNPLEVDVEASDEESMESFPAPKKTKTTARPREKQKSPVELEAEASEEEIVDLFPEPKLEKKKPDAQVEEPSTPLTVMAMASSKGRKPAPPAKPAPRKGRTRDDTKIDEDAHDPQDELFPTQNEPSAPPSTPQTKPKAKSSLVKQATTSTPTPSIASNASSPPSHIKYGFKPRKTRSAVAKTPATKGEAKATPKTVKGKQTQATPGTKGKAKAPNDDGEGEGDEDDVKIPVKEPELRRSTRQSTMVPEQDQGANIVDADGDEDAVGGEFKQPRRSTRHVSTAAQETSAAPTKDLDSLRRSTCGASTAPTTAPNPNLEPPTIQDVDSLRRSTRHTPTIAPDPTAGPTKDVDQLRRSTRHASTVPPPDAAPSSKKSRAVKVKDEAQETDGRTTRRASVQEREENVGKRLRSGDQAGLRRMVREGEIG
jgi:hypothetical protein